MGDMARDGKERLGPECSLAVGDKLHGFVVEDVQELPEIDGRAYVMRHGFSRTPLLWLSNDDPNMSFAVAFKTPPADDTGVFHILEHSVLCGSERFPVKEPFVDLLKTSMQTFLNALTFPDKTVYPVSSTNEQDLLNLMDVYMDAVLHPLLYRKPEVFLQEGWHYELDEEPAAPGDAGAAQEAAGGEPGREAAPVLSYNGVVFNEMKGACSDPEEVALQALNRALFPDTAYGFESGGLPRAIPTLTYEAYRDAHRRHYTPSNARVVLYGNVSLDRELELLDTRYLGKDAPAISSLSCGLPLPGKPNPLCEQAPVVDMDARATMDTSPDNATVMAGFVVGTYRDRTRVLAVSVLVDALMGSNEAPLKRALLDAGLGTDVDAFLYDGVLQPYAVFEVRGAVEDASERFFDALRGVASRLVEEGIPRDALTASLESLAFRMRERDFGYSDGVSLTVSTLAGWLYDDAMPCDYLRYEDQLAWLRKQLDQGYFERLLAQVVLDNGHRAMSRLVPVPGGEDSAAAQERAELDGRLAQMGPGQRRQTLEQADRLHRMQASPDSPEALATLPQLRVDQVGDAPAAPAYGLAEDAPVPTLRHEAPTRKIDYVSCYFDLGCLDADELPAATLLASLLGQLGTAEHDASQLDRLVEERLGRMNFSTTAYVDERTGEPHACMVARACSIEENVADLARIPAEVWSSSDLGDVERIRTLLQQQRLEMEQTFTSSGHSAALGRALAYVSRPHALAQAMGGVTYYRFMRDLLGDFDAQIDRTAASLRDIARRVFRPGNVLVSFTGAPGQMEAYFDSAARAGAAVLSGPAGAGVPEEPRRLVVPEPAVLSEAFVVPADVCFVAKAAGPAATGATYSGTWNVACRALDFGFLWDEVRVQGGAYGVGSRVTREGSLGFYSYRDPNLDRTLERMDRAGTWLSGFDPDEREMDGYVVSTVATHDAPKKPRILASMQDIDYLSGRSPDDRNRQRGEQLSCTPQTLRALAPCLDGAARDGAVCVFGSRQLIESSHAGLNTVDLFNE